MIGRALGVALLCGGVSGEVVADRVTSLPGFKGTLPTRHWSGYIAAPKAVGPEGTPVTAHFHYYLVENAAKDPKAPTVVWNNGGPGSSSLIGMITENGPFTLNDDSFNTESYEKTGIPEVFLNPNSWSNHANMLYVEHPAPTGFSYCSDAKGKDSDCGPYNDTSQSFVNYHFLVSFFEAYPELAMNEFYITGESYAGVLVPTVSMRILETRTEANKNKAPWSLKGFMLGNDCPGNHVFTCTPYSGWIGTQTSVDFYFGHGMIPNSKYAEVNEKCAGHWGTYEPPPEPCKSLLGNAIRPLMEFAGDTYQMGGGYFLYDSCGKDLMTLDEDGRPRIAAAVAPPREGAAKRGAGGPAYALDAGEYACGQERANQIWLNIKEVQDALHVGLHGKSEWGMSVGLNYTYTAHTLVPDYNDTLIANFRILQYSGDADPCVPYVGTQKWIDSLELPVKNPWHPWTAPGTMPVTGYLTTYDTARGFAFATIRDAGHMAPRHKPRESTYLFASFLNGTLF